MDTLISNVTVVTMNERMEVLFGAYIGITDGKIFKRSNDRTPPDYTYTSIEKALDRGEQKGYETEKYEGKVYSFHDEFTTPEGEAAEKVTLRYIKGAKYNAVYEYDADTQTYARFTSGEKAMDKELDEQIHVSNIIIQFAKYTTIDDADRQDVEWVKDGKGLYITGGKVIDIEWSKSGRFEETTYTVNGEELKLNVGKTAIHIMPKNAEVKLAGTEA